MPWSRLAKIETVCAVEAVPVKFCVSVPLPALAVTRAASQNPAGDSPSRDVIVVLVFVQLAVDGSSLSSSRFRLLVLTTTPRSRRIPMLAVEVAPAA